ncbi:MAG TPA: hypothetical protein VFP71_03035, partial [Candidatus Angelobacter sp.]|nr:hypothetical protein [Candidatus Angelobacter sp.]
GVDPNGKCIGLNRRIADVGNNLHWGASLLIDWDGLVLERLESFAVAPNRIFEYLDLGDDRILPEILLQMPSGMLGCAREHIGNCSDVTTPEMIPLQDCPHSLLFKLGADSTDVVAHRLNCLGKFVDLFFGMRIKNRRLNG